MRNMTKACAFLVVVCVAAFGQQQSPMQETLTNFKIIRMVQSNMSPDLIIQTISKCSPRFALDPISIENMKQNGGPFVRTQEYFGPDRRRREEPSYRGPYRRKT